MNGKPLGKKAYGSICHLSNSRLGESERHVHDGQKRICTEKARDKHDVIIVTEKVDGTNVAVVKLDGVMAAEHGRICALNRAGWPAVSAPRDMHRLFAAWVAKHENVFDEILNVGECLHGEWLALAHGTLYDLAGRSPFVAFDMTTTAPRDDRMRVPYDVFEKTCQAGRITKARLLSAGPPCSVENARELLEIDRGYSGLRRGERPEGAVWRVERRHEFDYLAKWVDPAKVDGKYLPEVSGQDAIWLWRP